MSNSKQSAALTILPAWRLAQEIAGRNVSCREVMEAFLDRIYEVNPEVNAIVALRKHSELLDEACYKDRLLADGIYEGWMHGFPQAIKDLEDTIGILSTNGYFGHKERLPEKDSMIVTRMKEAGSIIIGKTNTPEWGFGSNTYNEVYGATGNPFNPELTSGGSSGGAACAVALNMQAVADGSDFMGSLRNPAGFCGVFGFRPSWGRVPAEGADLFYQNCAVKGPMARNVPDLALLLSTLAGPDKRVPSSLEDDTDLKALTPDNVCERLGSDISGKRIAWMGDLGGYLPMEDGVLSVCEEALKKLSRKASVKVDSVAPFFDPAMFWEKVWLPIRHFGSVQLKPLYDNLQMRKYLKPEAVFEYESSLKYTASDLFLAGTIRSEIYLALLEVFEEYDFIAAPTAQVFPFDKNINWPEEIAGKKMDSYFRWMEVVSHWTMTGCPVAAVPAGFYKDSTPTEKSAAKPMGKPIGIQIIGKPRGDFELLKFAYGVEKALK